MDLKIEKTHPCVTTITMEAKEPDWCQWILLRSDAHHDSIHADHALEKRHLDEALLRNAGIIDIGDVTDCMQGRYDKRSDPESLRPELRGGDYFDKVIVYCAEFYKPYAANWLHLSPGNHETSVLKNTQTNITERLAERLRTFGSKVAVGPYKGWIRLVVKCIGGENHQSRTLKISYTHGYGGSSPVTRGVISTNRDAVAIQDADLVMSGHSHDSWSLPIRREGLNTLGRPVFQDVEFLKLGTYKGSGLTGQGWEVEKGMSPKSLGAYWMKLYTISDDKHRRVVTFDLIRAK